MTTSHVGRSPWTAADARVGQTGRTRGPARTGLGRPRHCQRGSALLAVLWLSAALSAIAFTVANTVRAETDRTGTDVDALKTYYLATGAIDRALLHVQWGFTLDPKYYKMNTARLRFSFPTGDTIVELI